MSVYFLLNDSPPSETVICTFPLHYFTAYDIRLRGNIERKDNFCDLFRATRTNNGYRELPWLTSTLCQPLSLTQISPPQRASWTTLTFKVFSTYDLSRASYFMVRFHPHCSCIRWGTVLLLLLFIKWILLNWNLLHKPHQNIQYFKNRLKKLLEKMAEYWVCSFLACLR